jgi:hypothetical protein
MGIREAVSELEAASDELEAEREPPPDWQPGATWKHLVDQESEPGATTALTPTKIEALRDFSRSDIGPIRDELDILGATDLKRLVRARISAALYHVRAAEAALNDITPGPLSIHQ